MAGKRWQHKRERGKRGVTGGVARPAVMGSGEQQHSDRANKVAAGGNVQKGHRQVGPSAQRERGISIIKIK
jgi:hypothetical protein